MRKQNRSLPYTADALAILIAIVGFYAFLMLRYPLIYGGDTIVRLVDPSRIVNGHQLPLLQTLMYSALRLHYGPVSVFLLMALISGAACAGMYAVGCALTQDRRTALLAAVLYGTHPFVLYYSRVPYEEPLLIAGVTWGFYFLFRSASGSRRLLASLCFGIACFTRYEGWIAAAIAAAFDFWHNRQEDRQTNMAAQLCKSAAIFGWAPAAWILWNGDLSPAGSYVLDLAFSWRRLYRPYFVTKSTLWWTESAVVLMAVIGFIYSWLEPVMRRDRRFHMLMAFVIVFLSVLPLSGHGIEPDIARIVTEREAFIPVALLTLYAGLGANRVVRGIGGIGPSSAWLRSTISILLITVLVGYSLNRGLHRVAAANADPELKTDYEIARYLAAKNARGLILAAPLPPELTENFLAGAEKWSGPKGRQKAVQLLSEAETTPLDYQRVLTYSWLGKQKVFSGEQLKGLDSKGIEAFLRDKAVDYLIIFSDFVPASEHENIALHYGLRQPAPGVEIRNGHKAARIYPVRLQLN